MATPSVRDLFDRYLDLEPEARRALLDTLDVPATTRAAVERLLTGAQRELPALDAPVADFASPLWRADSPVPEWLGRYRVLRLLGRGGMGSVFLAEQESPRREVAIKRLDGLHAGALERFRREAALLARLSHPGIATILEAGLDAGQPFLAMEYVDGVDLRTFAATLPRAARLELLARVCDAVEHAHARGIVHRDLKPTNILVRADGSPKVLDFGIARVVEGEATLTETGMVLGTPAYMAPEQATGGDTAVDARADVYALGAIAYELLVDRTPIALAGLTPLQAARAVVETTPAPLSRLDHSLRGDLEVVVGKALAKDASQRYPSAGALGDDLRRFLAHEPIRARPPTTWSRAWKFARRHPWPVASAAVAVLALVGGAAMASWFAYGERAERVRAQQALAVAESERARAASTLEFVTRLLAQADPSQSGRPDLAVRDVLERALPQVEALPLAQQAPLLLVLADALHGYGDTIRALELYARALQHWEPAAGPRGRASLRYGAALVEAGRYDAAREQLLPLQQDLTLDPHDRQRLAAELGRIAINEGNLEEAARQRAILESAPALSWPPGEVPPALRLAGAELRRLLDFGRDEPRRAALAALRPAVAALGEDHPFVLALGNYEWFDLREDRERLAAAQANVERHRRVLGASHPATLEARAMLAEAYNNQALVHESYAEAKAVLEQAAKSLPDSSLVHATLAARFVLAANRLGRHADAVAVAAPLHQRLCPEAHEVFEGCIAMAGALMTGHAGLGDAATAEEWAERLLRALARRADRRDLHPIVVRLQLANELAIAGLRDEARRHGEIAEALVARLSPGERDEARNSDSQFAWLAMRLGNYERALEIGLRLHEQAMAADGRLNGTGFMRLVANSLVELGRPREALPYIDRAWARVKAHPPIHPGDRVDAARTYAKVYRALGDEARAQQWIAVLTDIVDAGGFLPNTDRESWAMVEAHRAARKARGGRR